MDPQETDEANLNNMFDFLFFTFQRRGAAT